jgi:hypothetical protein
MGELTESFLVKMSTEDLAALDRVRADTPRATWVKQLIAGAVEARERMKGPTGVWVINEREMAKAWPDPTPKVHLG